MKNVIFISPPAAGKGTQSKKLVDLGYTHVSAGDLLRDEIRNKTKIGLEIDELISKGNLVKDELIFNIVKNKLATIDGLFIIDGYPRTIGQAKLLNDLFVSENILNYEVIYLDISEEEAMKRALGRLSCTCGASYNLYDEKFLPKVSGICDKCGKELTTRSDDNEESFKVRFQNFIKNTEPIKDYYESLGKLHIIDATLDYNEITDIIKDILK